MEHRSSDGFFFVVSPALRDKGVRRVCVRDWKRRIAAISRGFFNFYGARSRGLSEASEISVLPSTDKDWFVGYARYLMFVSILAGE